MGNLRMSNKVIMLLLASLLLASCSLAPGMRMHESGLNEQSVEEAEAARIDLLPITAGLVIQQMNAEPAKPDTPALPIDDSSYVYRVKAQDILQITVWDHPELTIPEGQFRAAADSGTLVHTDGTIFYPYVGVLEVADLTLQEIRARLTRKLAEYVEKPQLEVRVAVFRSQKVYVTGEVMKPGAVALTDEPMHVLDAVNAAGGVVSLKSAEGGVEADLEHVQLTRDGQSYMVDLMSVLRDGDVGQNYLLQDGDLLHVPDNMKNKVFVLGEVKNPSALLIHKGYMTLAEALGDVGGVDMASANPSRIYVIRSGAEPGPAQGRDFVFSAKAAIYKLDASSPDALILADQFRLKPRDVVFVSTAPVVAWGRVINQLQSTIQAIYLGRVAKIY
jgi:polysaccharide export outer membrane protein